MSEQYQSSMPSPTSNPMQPQPKKSGGKTCVIICVVVAVVGVLGCGGCGLGIWWLMSMGMGVIGEEVIATYGDHETVQEKLGGIDSISFSWSGTQEAAEASPGSLAFDVEGPKGSGQIRVVQVGESVTDGRLLINGEEFELD